jgi:hypothetical protein
MRASVVIPTKHRAPYLDVALRSLAPQAARQEAELLVVDDGPSEDTRAVAVRHGARYVAHDRSLGLNAARNTGIDATTASSSASSTTTSRCTRAGLPRCSTAPGATPTTSASPGRSSPLRRLRPRFCGREGPAVTSLDLGPADTVAPHAWGANMAVRRSAVARVGRFDASLGLYGDEQEWQARLHAAGGRIRYLAGAALDHRRAGADAHVGALAGAARSRGRAARREDVAKGQAPPVAAELRVLAGTLLHGPRFRCANGPILTAHSLGRLEEALRPAPAPGAEDFLSGRSGHVAGRRRHVRAVLDAALDVGWRRGQRRSAPRRVLAIRHRASRQPDARRPRRAARHRATTSSR